MLQSVVQYQWNAVASIDCADQISSGEKTTNEILEG